MDPCAAANETGDLHVTYERATTLRCWECEAETHAPRTVILRAGRRDVGTLALCPSCYSACYLPLAGEGSGVLRVETDDSSRPLAR
jgi:hypothetical protein